MTIRPFKLLKKSELDYIRIRADDAINQWQSRWCQDNVLSYTLEVEPITRTTQIDFAEGSNWLVGSIGNGNPIALNWSKEAPDVLYNSFVDIRTAFKNTLNVRTLISRKLINHAITALIQEIYDHFGKHANYIGTLDYDLAELSEKVREPGSGYVLLAIRFHSDGVLNILLDSTGLLQQDDTDKRKGNLAATLTAFGNSKVAVRAHIGTAELNIADLTKLSVGDVISVDKKLDEKISLLIDNDEFCQGFLGKADNFYSIQITD